MAADLDRDQQLPPVEEVVERLQLQPHPEGGWFRELHRGDDNVVHADGRKRSTGTLIYFLLGAGEASGWHVVSSDEYWSFLDGDPLELHEVDVRSGDPAQVHRSHRFTMLGRPTLGYTGAHTVPARAFQGARTLGTWSLVSCTVAPGFDFEDFRLLSPKDPEHAILASLTGTRDLLPKH